MNSRVTRDNNFGSRRGFVLASDGGRNLPMEYDDGEFTDKDCQLAEKDSYQSNTEGHQQGLPQFDIGEHIAVQLGFDSLEESVLLQDQSQREEAWGSHFSREENGVLGLEAVSQNIEFSSTTTETCTISRHINVWSEATSTESVQMLLNSVGEDEGKLVEESKAQESLPSYIEAVLDAQAEKSAEIDQRGLKSSAMDARYQNQNNSISSELAPGNTLEQNSASRPEDEGYIPNEEDNREKLQMVHTESEQQSAITASSQQMHADFEQTELQVTSIPELPECNIEKTGRCAIEVMKQDEPPLEAQEPMSTVHDETRNDITKKNATLEHATEVNLQGGARLLVDESNSIQCSMQKSPESFISSEVQGTSRSSMEKPILDKTIKDSTDGIHADVPLATPSQGIETANEQDVGKMQESVEQKKVDSTQHDTEKHVAGVSHENVVGKMKESVKQKKVDSTQHDTGKLVAGVSHENVVLADILLEKAKNIDGGKHVTEAQGIETANEQDVGKMQESVEQKKVDGTQYDTEMHVAVVSHENVVLADILLEKAKNIDGGEHATEVQGIETANEQDVGKMHERVEQKKIDSTQYDTDKHVAGVSHENVVLADILLEKAKSIDGGKRVTEATNKDVLLASNDENSNFDGEQGITSDKQSLGTSSLLQEKANDKGTVVQDDILAPRQIMLGLCEGDSKPEEHAHDKSSLEPDFQKSKELSDPMEVDSIDDQTQKHVLGVTPENAVLVEAERNQSMLLQNDNGDGEGKHVTEASIKHEGEQGMAGSDEQSIETPTGISLKTGETIITPTKGDNYKESRLVIQCLQNQKVLSTPAEELMNDGTGSSAGDAAEKCLLEDNKSVNMHESGNQEPDTPEKICISSSDFGKNHENECKSTSIESVVTVRENETLDEVNDFSERKTIAPVLHSGIERDKHIAGAISVQEPTMLTLPTEQTTTGKCQEPLQTPEMDAKVEVGPIEQADQKNQESEKGFKEVNMLHAFKEQVDRDTEMALEVNNCVSHNESASVKECDVYSLEVGQMQENETKNTSTGSVVTTMETDSPEGKEMPLLPQTDVETCEHDSEAVLVQDSKEAALPEGQVMTDIIKEPVRMTDACLSPVGVKEVNTSHDSKALEHGDKELLFSDDQQCIPLACSGDSSQQTLKVSPSDISEREVHEKVEKDEQQVHSQITNFPLKEAEEFEKDKDVPEAMEVSLEVGISLEPDNESPARDEDGKTLQGKVSVGNVDLASSGKWSVNSKVGGNKVDGLGTAAGDLEGSVIYKTDDTFKFDVGTKDATSGGEIVSSADFVTSDHLDKNAECWKNIQATQSREVRKDNASAVCQSEEVQAEACQENANDYVSRSSTISVTDSVVQEGQVKGKHVPSEEKISQENGTKELEKKSTIHHQKAVDVQVPSTSIANSTQSISSSALQTSTLPDLNATVAPMSVLFQQPFTDSQQVQLRAQILVYGSLIQGALPEEALMLTAFADIGGASQNDTPLSDGGRSLWENAWHSAADRIHRKTFSHTSEASINASGPGTPAIVSSKILEGMKTPSIVNVTDSRNSLVQGLRSADLAASRSHSLQTRVTGTPNIGRSGSKNVPSAIMSPPRPVNLSSSVWGMSSPMNEGMQGINIPRSLHVDPHQMAVARHLYQSPQLGHYPPPANSNPWLSPLHFPGPWLPPPQGTLPEPGLPFSSFLVPEVAQETHNNRRTPASSSAPHPSMTHAITHFPSMGVASTGHVTNVNMDISKGIVGSGKQSSSEQKSRKRKKKSVSEEIAPSGGLTPSGPKVKSVTGASKHVAGSTPVSSQGLSITATTSSNALYSPSTNVPPVSNYQIISRGETGQRVIFSEETASRIEQAKLSAEEAASSAASAVRHSQGIWGQLAAQKSSGLVSECEAKLASAAVAAAAAASVAKAAAAAAKVASDAAVQAKLMATEALNSDGKQDSSHSTEARLLEGNQGHSRSIISAARETAKKRVEAASAATKRAENLDAVVRAAELAAQAVTQAGAIVAMGDPVPLTLNALLEAGPETYWKLVTEQAGTQKDDNVHSETPPHEVVTSVEKNTKLLKSKSKRDAHKSETIRNPEGVKSSSSEMLKLVEKGCRLMPTVPLNSISTEKDSVGRKENQLMGTAQSSVIISDAEAVSTEAMAAPEAEHITETYKKALALKANEIKEGSFVEVVSDEEGLRGVWFAAKVLSLNDGKALVLYDELLSDEGPGQLQEWIPLEGENGKPPRIRVAHPMTVMKFERFQQMSSDFLNSCEMMDDFTRSHDDNVSEKPQFYVGLERSIEDLKGHLFHSQVSVVGVHGMAGGGKTTLALALCNDLQVKDYFHNNVIFVTVSQFPDLKGILETIWEKIAGKDRPEFKDVEDARIELHQLILSQSKPTLIILDDVWSKQSLKKLLFEGKGYKTLITTRDKSTIPTNPSTQLYQLPLLGPKDALSLFCFWAIGETSIPSDTDANLMQEVLAKCDGLPLALKVIGSSLHREPHEVWKNKLSKGEYISDYCEKGLFRSLQTSIDSLDDVTKECFLDSAIFPKDRKICVDALLDIWVYVRKLQKHETFAILSELANKSLLNLTSKSRGSTTISYENASELYISQHNVMRDLALYLAQKDNGVYCKRLVITRMECSLLGGGELINDGAFDTQILSVLTEPTEENHWPDIDFPETEALLLLFTSREYFLPSFLKSMKKLKILMVFNCCTKKATVKGLNVLSSLPQLKSVRLERLISPLVEKQSIEESQNLEKISLSLCEGFRNISTFNTSKLQDFNLDHSSDLEELPLEICNMPFALSWSITNCHLLQNLPYDLGNMSHLRILRLSALPGLKELPVSIGKLEQLEYLDISVCERLKQLPKEIGQLKKLIEFDMRECSRLTRLPTTVCQLSSLKLVTCDEKIGKQWMKAKNISIPELKVEIVEPHFSLDWLED